MVYFLAHSCFKKAKIRPAFCSGDRKRNPLAGHKAVLGQQALVKKRRSRQEYLCDQRETEGRKKNIQRKGGQKTLQDFFSCPMPGVQSHCGTQKMGLRLCDCGGFW